MQTPIGTLTARVPGLLHASVGDTVHLSWQAGHAHVFDAASERRVA